MFILRRYAPAVFFCVITMLCWGSWANTQKLAGADWRFELFYWDYVVGVLLMSLVFAFTLGSRGSAGRPFLDDLRQADRSALRSALVGGVVFNLANLLLVAAIAIAGMSVAFPVGIGLALVLGVVLNYVKQPKGNPTLLFTGVALITAAIVLCAVAYSRLPSEGESGGGTTLGLVLALLCGLLMGSFYRFVAAAMADDFVEMPAGRIGPYTAMVAFAVGVFVSNFVFNTVVMYRPPVGDPVSPAALLDGSLAQHGWGVLGGAIWAVGMTLSIIAFGVAGPAISYGLGQGATLVAALWGVFVWQEFAAAPTGVSTLLALMFAGYVAGLALIIRSGA
ncbi:MAG: multidrug DMT transporter permease [Planctomycetota bacterium]